VGISAALEGARNKNGNLSLWRVPNMLFEPRGLYLGESDAVIERLNKWRSIAAVIMLAAIAFRYNEVYTTSKSHRAGITYYKINIGQNSAATAWVDNAIAGIFLSAGVVLLVGGAIIWATSKGRRASAARQLCWPVVTMASFAVYLAIVGILIALLNSKITALSGIERAGLSIVALCTVGVWFIKSLYLAATGLLRADDGHPLLAPLTVPIVAWIFAVIALLGKSPSGIPHKVDLLALLAGPASVTIISGYTILRLRHQYRQEFPFREGPLPRTVPMERPAQPEPAERY
jgi:hypothetical protein